MTFEEESFNINFKMPSQTFYELPSIIETNIKKQDTIGCQHYGEISRLFKVQLKIILNLKLFESNRPTVYYKNII